MFRGNISLYHTVSFRIRDFLAPTSTVSPMMSYSPFTPAPMMSVTHTDMSLPPIAEQEVVSISDDTPFDPSVPSMKEKSKFEI